MSTRSVLVRTLNTCSYSLQEYERTGYVWEQYDALTGEGKRSHPFTGWTSLVTLSKR